MSAIRIGRPIARLAFPAAVAVVALAATAAALAAVDGVSRWPLLGALGAAALAALFVIPVRVLPTVALVMTVFLPYRLLHAAGFTVSTPITLILGVWALRKAIAHREPSQSRRALSVAVPAILLLVCAVLHTVVSARVTMSLGWTVTFALAVAIPLLVRDARADTKLLGSAFGAVAAVAAAVALGQAALHANPLYDAAYTALGLPSVQHWEVYRVDGSFGHPLNAGLFFSVALAFSAGRWVETRRRRFAANALLQAVALAFTVSRSAYIAAGVGVLFVVVAGLLSARGLSRGRSLLIVAGFGLFALITLQSSLFVERATSAEAASSTQARDALLQISLDAAGSTNWLGGGVAAGTIVAEPFNYLRLPIENAYLQLLLGIGVPGLILFVWLITAAVVRAWRRCDVAAAGACVAFATGVAGYAAMDTNMNVLALLGLVLLLCAAGGPGAAEGSGTAEGRGVDQSFSGDTMESTRAR